MLLDFWSYINFRGSFKQSTLLIMLKRPLILDVLKFRLPLGLNLSTQLILMSSASYLTSLEILPFILQFANLTATHGLFGGKPF